MKFDRLSKYFFENVSRMLDDNTWLQIGFARSVAEATRASLFWPNICFGLARGEFTCWPRVYEAGITYGDIKVAEKQFDTSAYNHLYGRWEVLKVVLNALAVDAAVYGDLLHDICLGGVASALKQFDELQKNWDLRR